MAELRAIIGLGNPGADYAKTRHNAGFWLLDRLAEIGGGQFRSETRFHSEVAKVRLEGHELILLKPLTFMNRSGLAVQALASFYKWPADSLLIAHDELDLPAGAMRLKSGGGHGGHNGLRDIHAHLGESYLRMRIGIGHPGHKDRVLGHVLGRAGASEQAEIDQGLDHGVDAIRMILKSGWEKAVQHLHSAKTS